MCEFLLENTRIIFHYHTNYRNEINLVKKIKEINQKKKYRI